ncbi:MAG TPA: hypothetical protein PK263_03540 [bacterium]|nr:hypothetical protein [bacterium]
MNLQKSPVDQEIAVGPECLHARPDVHFGEISPAEISHLDDTAYPYGSLIRVFREDGTQSFQPMEPKDGEAMGLEDYRREEIDRIIELLRENMVVALIAPSRAGKTEAVLIGEHNLKNQPSALRGKTGATFVEGSMFPKDAGYDKELIMEDALENYPGTSQIVIFDEFEPRATR